MQTKRWRILASLSVLPVLMTTLVLYSQQKAAGGQNGQVLSNGEMAVIFGDDTKSTDPCVGSFNCRNGFFEGTNCAYCDVGDARTQCCESGKGTTCTYDTVVGQCGNAVRKVGGGQGAGTCKQCTSSGFVNMGMCTLKKATGTGGNCP